MSEDIIASRKKVIGICRQIIDGKIGIVLASRQLRELAFRAFPDHGRPKAFDPFIGIDSEADGIPTGPERCHWSSDALQKKDSDLAVLEKTYHDLALKSARALIEYLEKNV